MRERREERVRCSYTFAYWGIYFYWMTCSGKQLEMRERTIICRVWLT